MANSRYLVMLAFCLEESGSVLPCWIGCNWKSTLFINALNSSKKKKPFNLPLKTIQKFYIMNYGYVKFR